MDMNPTSSRFAGRLLTDASDDEVPSMMPFQSNDTMVKLDRIWKWIEPFVFLGLSMTILLVLTLKWGDLHKFWDFRQSQGSQEVLNFDYTVEGAIGRMVELIFWVTWTVQLRWIGNTISAALKNSFRLRPFVLMWLFDTLNTPFVCWILITFLQSFTISFTENLSFSLAEANVILFGAICALLGMSVGETQELLLRLSRGLFERLTWNQAKFEELDKE